VITGSRLPARDAGPGHGMPCWLARQVQALFAEARARRRRRRLAAATLVSAVLAGTVLAGYLSGGHRGRPSPAPRQAAAAHARSVRLPSALVAWFDAGGGLRIGNVATLAQHRVAQAGSQPCCRMVLAGDRIYWPGRSGGRDYVQEYDLATGVIRNVAPGWAVFASASGRGVYIAQSGRRLLELPGASGRARQLVTPPGWQVVPLPWAAGGGIVLSSTTSSPVIGVWQPDAGTVKAVGHGYVQTTWTAPSGRGSLIAWQPAGCPLQHCPVEITSTATGRTLTVRSPLRYGFLGQGNDMAFSPDGTELAALISINPLSSYSQPRFFVALVNTATGTVRLVRRAVLANGELAGWLLWLPGSSRLVAGPAADIANYAGYAIDARTGAARPFSFFAGSSYPANASADITYGAVLVPFLRFRAAPTLKSRS
jgi:hypothetical protein